MPKEISGWNNDQAMNARHVSQRPARVLSYSQESQRKRMAFLSLAGLFILYQCISRLVFRPNPILSNDSYHMLSEDSRAIGSVTWGKCDVPVAPGIDCGSIVVPLNYFNLSEGTSTLYLARYNATKERRGTVFLNPGGPGGAGSRLVLSAGKAFADIIGSHYDLIGFDPRGIGRTTPKVRCFPSPMARKIFSANTVLEQGFVVSSNISDPHSREFLVEQQREFLTLYQTQAQLCAENMGSELKFMGTANVVRDIDFMTTVFDGEEALINFWGGSYGTILGAYLVNMLPSRVGKVLIDGVANPIVWSEEETHFWPRDFLTSTEETYKWFLQACSSAGPDLCPLALAKDEDHAAIERRIDDFLDQLYISPLPVPNSRRPGYLTSGGVRTLLLVFLERPSSWRTTSKLLAEAMAGDGSGLLNMLLPQYDINLLPDGDLARQAVSCLDAPRPAKEADFPTPELLADLALDTMRNVSKHFGASMSASEPDGGCQFWPVKGPERFTGPWNSTLKNPILIVSNTADPVTPIASGRLVHKLLSNSSALLVQNSPGHCSLALASSCTIKAVRAYYSDGRLPPPNLVCEVDEEPFTAAQDSAEMGPAGFSAEDVILFQAVRTIRDVMFDGLVK